MVGSKFKRKPSLAKEIRRVANTTHAFGHLQRRVTNRHVRQSANQTQYLYKNLTEKGVHCHVEGRLKLGATIKLSSKSL